MAGRRGAGGSSRDSGTVTAETALVLPGLVLVLAAVLATGRALAAELRCMDAARSAARLAARGEPDGVVRARADRLAPPGSDVEIAGSGAEVTVRVQARVSLPLGLDVPVRAAAAADREQP